MPFEPVVMMAALPGPGDEAAVKQPGQVCAGGRGADTRQLREFASGEGPPVEQSREHGGPGGVGRRRRGRRDISPVGGVGQAGRHISTVAEASFADGRTMSDDTAKNPGSLVETWTLREIAGHVAEVTYYAEQVGSLT